MISRKAEKKPLAKRHLKLASCSDFANAISKKEMKPVKTDLISKLAPMKGVEPPTCRLGGFSLTAFDCILLKLTLIDTIYGGLSK